MIFIFSFHLSLVFSVSIIIVVNIDNMGKKGGKKAEKNSYGSSPERCTGCLFLQSTSLDY